MACVMYFVYLIAKEIDNIFIPRQYPCRWGGRKSGTVTDRQPSPYNIDQFELSAYCSVKFPTYTYLP